MIQFYSFSTITYNNREFNPVNEVGKKCLFIQKSRVLIFMEFYYVV